MHFSVALGIIWGKKWETLAGGFIVGGIAMKNALRMGIMFLLSVALCMCFAYPAFAEEFNISDTETYDAHGVYVNEENFPDEYFRQYVLNNYGTYLSSGEIASAKVINCSRSYYVDDGYVPPADGYTEEQSNYDPEGNTTYIDPEGNVIIFDPNGNIISTGTIDDNQDNQSDGNNDEIIPVPPDMNEGEVFTFDSPAFHSSEAEVFASDDGDKIRSLKGIEYFTELEELYCSGNDLSKIDLSKNPALRHLYCSANKLLSLDVSGNKALTTLDCSHNQLTSLDLYSNVGLESIVCSNNQLTDIDFSGNTALKNISCANNQLVALDLSSNTFLEFLICSKNRLTALDIHTNVFLRSINCMDNAISSLNLKNKDQMRFLNCADNQIDYINIEGCPVLLKLAEEEEPTLFEGKIIYGDDYGDEWGFVGFMGESKGLTIDETVKLIPVNCHAFNEANFPDAIFRAYVAETFDTDGDLYLCKDEIEAATEMDCSGLGIQNLKGLEFFYNLKKLNCSGNSIEYLTISQSADLLVLINRVQPAVSENHITYADADASLIYDVDTVLADAIHPQWIVNKTNFPDAIFRDYISNNIDQDSNGFLSEEEIAAVTWIDCSGNGEEIGSIQSLKGLEIFQNLELLDCSYNRLRDLDVSNNPKLKNLDCSTNRLVGYLDVTTNPVLETLWCYSNWLEDVDLGNNENLIELWCNDNQLMALDISGLPGLKVLWCDTNKLTELDTTENPALEKLCCANNRLEKLNLSQNHTLTTLWCFNNRIEELYLFNNPDLKKLGCYGNFMSELDISPCAALCELAANRPYSERDGAVYYFDESSTDPVYLQYDIGTTLITSHTSDLILPSSLTVIDSEAFAGGAFSYVKLPDGAVSIGWHAFADCPNLMYIYIPATTESIDAHAFDGEDRLTIIGVPGSEAETYARLHGFAFTAAE